jgi:hypothetical protein
MEFVDVTLICQGVVVVAGGRDSSSQRFEPLGVLTVKWRDINLKKFGLRTYCLLEGYYNVSICRALLSEY